MESRQLMRTLDKDMVIVRTGSGEKKYEVYKRSVQVTVHVPPRDKDLNSAYSGPSDEEDVGNEEVSLTRVSSVGESATSSTQAEHNETAKVTVSRFKPEDPRPEFSITRCVKMDPKEAGEKLLQFTITLDKSYGPFSTFEVHYDYDGTIYTAHEEIKQREEPRYEGLRNINHARLWVHVDNKKLRIPIFGANITNEHGFPLPYIDKRERTRQGFLIHSHGNWDLATFQASISTMVQLHRTIVVTFSQNKEPTAPLATGFVDLPHLDIPRCEKWIEPEFLKKEDVDEKVCEELEWICDDDDISICSRDDSPCGYPGDNKFELSCIR